jgi:adenine phosphoribosyltransferase
MASKKRPIHHRASPSAVPRRAKTKTAKRARGPTAKKARGPTAKKARGPTAKKARGPTAKKARGPTAKRARVPRIVSPVLPLVARPTSSFEYCRSLIRDVPDFPTPGILFKDLTPLLASPRALHIVLDGIAERYIGEHIDAVVGVEARGFIFGGALAARLNASFVPARKPGKLPCAVDHVDIATEYSRDALEMHKDSLPEEARVLVVDDVLATGGTAGAAAELVHKQGAYVIGFAFVVELSALGGRERLLPTRIESCIVY